VLVSPELKQSHAFEESHGLEQQRRSIKAEKTDILGQSIQADVPPWSMAESQNSPKKQSSYR